MLARIPKATLKQQHTVAEPVEDVALIAQQTQLRPKPRDLTTHVPESRTRQITRTAQQTRIPDSHPQTVRQRIKLTTRQRALILSLPQSLRHRPQIPTQLPHRPLRLSRTTRDTSHRPLKIDEAPRHPVHIARTQGTEPQRKILIVTPQPSKTTHLLTLSRRRRPGRTLTLRLRATITGGLLTQRRRMRPRNTLPLSDDAPRQRLLTAPLLTRQPVRLTQRRRIPGGLLTQRRRVSLRHTTPQRDNRASIRLLTTALLTRTTLSLTLLLSRRTHRLTTLPLSLTLPISRITRTTLRHGILTTQRIVQVIKIQTSALQLTAQITELVLSQFTVRSSTPQIPPQQPHGPAHEVHLVTGKPARPLELTQPPLKTGQ